MTIDDAIANLSIQIEGKHPLAQKHQADAIKLGIEALKAYAQARRLGLPLRCDGLPGETKD